MSLEEQPADLDWVQLRKDMGEGIQAESATDKFSRKVYGNPFVPIGCLLTVSALSYGLWNFRQGKREMSQQMMRLRIVAQGFTIAALLIGVITSTGKPSTK